MRCHYCDLAAVYAAESEQVRVGLCERHLKEQVADITESVETTELAAVVDAGN